ncbi:MAG: hypothetical protein E6Q99_03980 [Elusimicrobia bacterium]|nr:MAG: hypothetical protein E6Q99_03980 [Elusimicrobiota bacterium]
MDQDRFPIPAPAFDGASRQVEIGNLFQWFREGWAAFVVNPGNWLAMMLIVVIAFIGVSIVPFLGGIVAQLLTPLLAAGLLVACRKIANEQPFTVADLFAGFQQKTGELLMLGVVYLVAVWVIALLVVLFAGGGVVGGLAMGNPLGLVLAAGGFLVGGLLWLLLSIPLTMAMWFAPALVLFNDMAPVAALKASFQAWLKNFTTFLVLGLLLLIATFFAVLPFGLGLLVLGPVVAGTVYASYRDIFLTT